MNLAKAWRKRRWLIEELRDRLNTLQDTINNRNDLIRMQDEEITRLRRELKIVRDVEAALDDRLARAVDMITDLEKDRDYWQGKAANP
jgi:hypothetical protein